MNVSHLEDNDKGHNFILYHPLHLLLNAKEREESAYWGARWW